jgi:hypothetical protein
MSKPKAGEEVWVRAIYGEYKTQDGRPTVLFGRRIQAVKPEDVLPASALAAPQPSDLERAKGLRCQIELELPALTPYGAEIFDKVLAAEFAQVRAEATDKVRELVAKWRERADKYRQFDHLTSNQGDGFSKAADELEATLGKGA